MGPTPAKFRLEMNPSNSDGGRVSSTDTVRPEQENIPQAYDRPFYSAVRKSPLSPSRTAIVQATRQQQSAVKGSSKKSSTPASMTRRNAPSSSNTEPFVTTTPRSAYFKVKNEETKQQDTPASPQQKSQDQEPRPQIDIVSVTNPSFSS
jgi:hypothetical protein